VLNYARLVARSRELQNKGYIEESFTLLMVAMESLLAGRDSISDTLSRRAGALWALGEDKSFEECFKSFQKLYDARSRFVHEGGAIDGDALSKLQEIGRIVFFAAYRSRTRCAEDDEAKWKVKWANVLDYICSCFNIAAPVDHSAANLSGILHKKHSGFSQ
jgi:Apea-like HEPN